MAFQGIPDGEDELSAINSNLKKLDFGQDVDRSDLGDEAGKKRLRGPDHDTDSLFTDEDCALGDEGFFYRKGSAMVVPGAMAANNTVVKLNKEEEDDLIRQLENEAMENDTLKELDEALMDRNTA